MKKTLSIYAFIFVCVVMCAARAAATPGTVSLDDLARMLLNGDKINLLDVRTPEEFAMFHLRGAVNIDQEQVADRLDELRGREWILYCRTSRRAALAADTLDTNGFENVRYVSDGMAAVPMFVKHNSVDQPELAAAIQDAVETMYPVAGFRHPPLNLETAAGRNVELFRERAGKTTALFFWRPGVPGDDSMFESAVAFSQQNKDAAFAPIPMDATAAALAAVKYKGDIFLDPGGAAAKLYGLEDAPMLALIDARGVLRAISFSAPDSPIDIYGNKSFAELAREAVDGKPMMFPDVGIYAEEKDPAWLQGKPAAAFTLPDEIGVPHSLADMSGKPVVLIFFSITCPYSQRELVALSEYQKRGAGARDVAVLAVTMNGGIEYQAQVLEFTSANGIEFPVLYDASGAVMAAYNVSSVPVWMALDANGTIGMVAVGFQENTDAILNESFAAMNF